MKKLLLIAAFIIISKTGFSQWTTSGTNIYFNTGNVGIGNTGPNSLLTLGGNTSALGGQQLAISFSPTATSGSYGGLTSQVTASPTANTTSAFYGIYSQIGTATGSGYNFTGRLAGVAGSVSLRGTGVASGISAFYALSPTFSSTGTATAAYGIYLNQQRVTGVGAAFGVYQAGATDSNYFAGSVGVGSTPSSAKLTVTQNIALGSVAKNSSLITSSIGLAGNHFMNNVWLVRNSAGTDWTTARLHDGVSIDATYTTPQVNTRTWWERDPHADIQSWGTGANTYLTINQGQIGINTTNTNGYMLAVNGSAIATSMTVKLYANWPDYVFKNEYKLPLLTDVKNFIDINHHLPGVPSAQEIANNGIDLGKMNTLLVKKVEELTLYMIDKDKQLAEETRKTASQQSQIDSQQKQIMAQQEQLAQIKVLLNTVIKQQKNQ